MINPVAANVGDLLSSSQFEVPQFQRGYEWRENPRDRVLGGPSELCRFERWTFPWHFHFYAFSRQDNE